MSSSSTAAWVRRLGASKRSPRLMVSTSCGLRTTSGTSATRHQECSRRHRPFRGFRLLGRPLLLVEHAGGHRVGLPPDGRPVGGVLGAVTLNGATAVGLIRGGLCGCPRMPRHAWRVRGVVRDGRGREAATRRRAISRGRSTSGDRDRWEGPNAKPSAKTFVLVVVALIAANPFGGLAGRVQR